MKKIACLSLAYFISTFSLWADGINVTGTNDRINYGSNLMLANCPHWSIAMWFTVTSPLVTPAKYLFHKGTDANGSEKFLIIPGAFPTELNIKQKLSVTNMSYRSSGIGLGVGFNYFVCGTFSINSVPSAHIYIGSPTVSAIEPAYGVATDGSGTIGTDAGASFLIGNVDVNAAPAKSDFYSIVFASTTFSQSDCRDIQFGVIPTSTGIVLLSFPNGAGSQIDYSENKFNGSLTGTTPAGLRNIPINFPGGAN